MDKVKIISDVVNKAAKDAREDAGYGGRMDDGGARAMLDKLAAWQDGINFAKTGQTVVYGHILKQYEKEHDAEYQEYLRLKEKFI